MVDRGNKKTFMKKFSNVQTYAVDDSIKAKKGRQDYRVNVLKAMRTYSSKIQGVA